MRKVENGEMNVILAKEQREIGAAVGDFARKAASVAQSRNRSYWRIRVWRRLEGFAGRKLVGAWVKVGTVRKWKTIWRLEMRWTGTGTSRC